MASNFQLLSYRNKNSLHLQLLYCDFDGNSAYELINTLKKMVRILFKFLLYFYLISHPTKVRRMRNLAGFDGGSSR